MDELAVIFGGDAITIPTDDFAPHLVGCLVNESHKAIRSYINEVEKDAPLSPAKSLMDKGKINLPDVRLDDCLSAAFYIFSGNKINEFEGSESITQILAHIYNVSKSALGESFDLEESDSIVVECNEWECYPVVKNQ